MTLTDINELRQQVLHCKSVQEVQALLDDNGEDNDLESAESVYQTIEKDSFSLKDGKVFLNGKLIACPDCKNDSPDKILSNAVEVLSASENAHFGCCECGTMF